MIRTCWSEWRIGRPGRRPLPRELFLDFPAKAAMLALDCRW